MEVISMKCAPRGAAAVLVGLLFVACAPQATPPVAQPAGFASMQAALHASAPAGTLRGVRSDWPPHVHPLIAAHQLERQRIAILPSTEQALAFSRAGLRPRYDREECAVYVRQRWSPAQAADLARQGIVVNPDIWIDAVPNHRHPYGFHLAHVPYSAMAALARDTNVARIVSVEVVGRPQNDLGRGAIGAKAVYDGFAITARTGAGVKVCVADSGMDPNNTDLPAPVEKKDVTDGDALANWGNDVSNNVSEHGTHVVGSAVGDGGYSNGKYRGAAPGASLYFYKIGDDVTSNTTDGDEIKALIRSFAVGCKVFSMSYGGAGSEVDGSGTVEQVIDLLSIGGMSTFIAAGNDGNAQQHMAVTLAPGATYSFTIQYSNTTGASDSTAIGIAVHWRDADPTDGNISLWDSTGTQVALTPTATNRGTEAIFAGISHTTAAGGGFNTVNTLLNAANGNATTAHIYIWGPSTITLQQSSIDTTIGSPAVADTAIAVGAFCSRQTWTNQGGTQSSFAGMNLNEMADFSSRGPRIDGVQKPDITSAGTAIISARNGDISGLSGQRLIDDDGLNLDGSGPAHYLVDLGTSMATPLAAGSAALLLEAWPNATRDYVYWAITSTGQPVSGANPPDANQGYGLLDIHAAILAHECGDGVVTGDEACDDGNDNMLDCCSTCTLVNICDDGDACTNNEHCTGGKCGGGTQMNCDDGNPCTGDSCSDGACQHQALNGNGCDDGQKCTISDACTLQGTCVGVDIICLDGNWCTDDICVAATGLCDFKTNHIACDDGQVCTIGDICEKGGCVGQPDTCNDQDPCTTDSCDPVDGCKHQGYYDVCDDGNLCTHDDFCDLWGNCHGTGTVCSDGNPCTTDSCNLGTGACQFPANTLACNDGQICTIADTCHQGSCAGVADSCNDGNACTNDNCDSVQGCQNVMHHDPCDDGNPCTIYDNCNSLAVCAGVAKPCEDGDKCTTDFCEGGNCKAAPTICDDGQPCTDDICDGVTGYCYSQAKYCGDTNDCTSDSCDSKTGECKHAALDGTVCMDPHWCTVSDKCVAGVCKGTPVVCKDDNPCTTDACNDNNGLCDFTSNSLPCSDGNVCTISDTCADSTCHGGSAANCDDGNGCTVDSCDAQKGGCQHGVPLASYPACDDGEPCTADGFCYAGSCVSGVPISCDDGNPCSDDSCLYGTGCQHVAGQKACDDGNPCTQDGCNAQKSECWHASADGNNCIDGNNCTVSEHCSGGKCLTLPLDCDDSNVCTTDSCGYVQGVPAGGCLHAPNTSPCQDGDACIVGDTCQDGACLPGHSTKTCDDDNVCTQDACEAGIGCIFTMLPGACTDANACTDDSCDGNGQCIHGLNLASCDDGSACTKNDGCQEGACQGSGVDCDDANVCTVDSCAPLSGCKHDAIGGPCEDGSACTAGDLCVATVCQGGAGVSCDDANVCTTDLCKPAGGCVAQELAAACSDGDPCTTGDTCKAGSCQSGSPTDCDDAIACTIDSCDVGSGCLHKIDDAPCNDAQPCTSDACDALNGCVHSGAAGNCDDGNPCTTDDACADGVCTGLTLAGCGVDAGADVVEVEADAGSEADAASGADAAVDAGEADDVATAEDGDASDAAPATDVAEVDAETASDLAANADTAESHDAAAQTDAAVDGAPDAAADAQVDVKKVQDAAGDAAQDALADAAAADAGTPDALAAAPGKPNAAAAKAASACQAGRQPGSGHALLGLAAALAMVARLRRRTRELQLLAQLCFTNAKSVAWQALVAAGRATPPESRRAVRAAAPAPRAGAQRW